MGEVSRDAVRMLLRYLVRHVVTDAGFTRFRRVAQTPFTLVFEARP